MVQAWASSAQYIAFKTHNLNPARASAHSTEFTMTAAKAILGIVLIVFVLCDTFETIILPRRPRHGFRITRMFYRTTWTPWKAIARSLSNPKKRETFLSFFGPLSTFLLLALWAFCLILGFAVLQWAAGSALGGSMSHS